MQRCVRFGRPLGFEPTNVNLALLAKLMFALRNMKLLHAFFYKHMKFGNQARLCLAVSDFEAHIMLSLCLTFQGYLSLGKRENITLVSLTNVYNSNRKLRLGIMLNFSPKIRLCMLINVMLIKKACSYT